MCYIYIYIYIYITIYNYIYTCIERERYVCTVQVGSRRAGQLASKPASDNRLYDLFQELYLCICMCIYIYIYIYVCICIYIYIYIYVCVYSQPASRRASRPASKPASKPDISPVRLEKAPITNEIGTPDPNQSPREPIKTNVR